MLDCCIPGRWSSTKDATVVKTNDLTGKKFTRLTVISRSKDRGAQHYWNCKCDCGKERIVSGHRLTSGKTKSCRCIRTTHGKSKTPEYHTWWLMKERCLNKTVFGYRHYGGRGIRVCKRWLHSFENFLSDMGERPKGEVGMWSIDRKNSNGNYTPSNCRWATKYEQALNRSCTVFVKYKGIKTALCKLAPRISKVNYWTIYYRIRTGWPVGLAMSTPAKYTYTKRKRKTL